MTDPDETEEMKRHAVSGYHVLESGLMLGVMTAALLWGLFTSEKTDPRNYLILVPIWGVLLWLFIRALRRDRDGYRAK